MDEYVAHPDKDGAVRLVKEYDRYKGWTGATAIAGIWCLISSVIFALLIYVQVGEEAFHHYGYILLVSGIVYSPVVVGLLLIALYFERRLEPHLKNGDVLKVDVSAVRRWRCECKNNPRIGQASFYDLQKQINATFAEWRRNLPVDS